SGRRRGDREGQARDAEGARQRLQREQILVGHAGRGEDPDIVGAVAREPGGNLRDRLLPRDLEWSAVSAAGGHADPGRRVDEVEAVAAVVADPPSVDVGVEAGL